MRSPLVEKVLEENPDILWEYRESVPLTTVDQKRSFENQARVGSPINDELVQQYTRALKNGDEFPALVGYEDGTSIINIDGNHRYASLIQVKRPTTDYYIVHTNNEIQRTALTFEFNTFNGRPQTDADRSAQAVTLVALGFDIKQVMERMHLSRSQVFDSLAEDAGRTRALHNGVKMAWDKIDARTARVKLQTIKLDKPFALAIQYVAKYQLPLSRVNELVKTVKALPSEEEQLAVLKAEISRSEENAKHKRGRLREPAPAFDAMLSHFLKIDTKVAINSMTAEERSKTKAKLLLASERIDKTLSLIDQ